MAAHDNPLGFGLGLRRSHFDFILKHNPDVDWFEVLSESYLANEGIAKEKMLSIAERYPIVLHGVSMSIGSVDPINFSYLKALKELAQLTKAKMISDHLCWTGVSGLNTHDLLPLPYTEEALEHCAQKIGLIQDYLGCKIYIENPSSYLSYKNQSLTEWQFLNELVSLSGCGLLLDINNIYVNSFNHQFSSEKYLRKINKDAIGYCHLAGHTRRQNYLLDSHMGPVPQSVWNLYRIFLDECNGKPVMIEWDTDIPEFPELLSELNHARDLVGLEDLVMT